MENLESESILPSLYFPVSRPPPRGDQTVVP